MEAAGYFETSVLIFQTTRPRASSHEMSPWVTGCEVT